MYSLSYNIPIVAPGSIPVQARFVFQLGELLAVDLMLDPTPGRPPDPKIGRQPATAATDAHFLALDVRVSEHFGTTLVIDDTGHAVGELGATRVTIDRLDRRIRLEASEV